MGNPAWQRYLQWQQREAVRQSVLDEQRAALDRVEQERVERKPATRELARRGERSLLC